jgi:uncharacterized DUF497 family protein
MRSEWDEERRKANLGSDSEQEQRWVLVGMSARGRLVTVVYTVRNEERIRFISARKATLKQAAAYA